MSAASIAAEVEGVGGQPVSAQTIRRTLHQIGLHGCCQRRSNGAGKAGSCLGPRILRGPPTADHLNNRK